jgi:hypothetical protein
MPDEKDKELALKIQTEGVPVYYSNVASVSVSFNDVRIYLGDLSPKEVTVKKVEQKPELKEGAVSPKLCLVCTPEFARNLRDAISISITQYEQFFGPLRPNPEEKQLRFLMENQKK